MFGLKQEHIEAINQCFDQFNEIDQVVIYGSRAKGNYRIGSDIDLMIVGDMPFEDLLRLEIQLDDLLLPYKIDLSLQHQITNIELLDHVDRVGKIFFNRNRQLVFNEPPVEYKASK